ncbi:type II secretion system protein GspK [Bradyrhizobium macuxiense]|uniref:type II secretion system protein GspK n=1 Tax=Bradyrhizobium macuxiense TaxID=1755647 RepID=UPI00136654B0|nr:type II secretion system protein GspK [Bradyrhizobium macuxiense]
MQADGLLTAGLEVAAGIAGDMPNTPITDRSTVVTLSTGSVSIRLGDESGRVDIGKAPVELLASLLRYVGADDGDADVIAKRIVDRRGPEQKAKPNDPAKQQPAAGNSDAQKAATTPQGNAPQANAPQANTDPSKDPSKAAPVHPAPFTDIRQLAGIQGMRPEWISALAPLITVYGSDTVNPLAAPVAVIRALPFVDEARLDTFLNMRGALVDPERLAFALGPAQKYLKVQERQVVSVDLVASTHDGYTAAAKAFIMLLSDSKQPYQVLAWNPASTSEQAVADNNRDRADAY